jgi:hypothetical protein
MQCKHRDATFVQLFLFFVTLDSILSEVVTCSLNTFFPRLGIESASNGLKISCTSVFPILHLLRYHRVLSVAQLERTARQPLENALWVNLLRCLQ